MLCYFCIMKFTCILKSAEIDSLKKGLIEYARKFDYACILDSHYDIFGSQIPFTQYDLVAGFGTKNNAIIINNYMHFTRETDSCRKKGAWGYDLKDSGIKPYGSSGMPQCFPLGRTSEVGNSGAENNSRKDARALLRGILKF